MSAHTLALSGVSGKEGVDASGVPSGIRTRSTVDVPDGCDTSKPIQTSDAQIVTTGDDERVQTVTLDATLARMMTLAVDAGDLDAAKRVLAELELRRRDAAPNVVAIDRKQRKR